MIVLRWLLFDDEAEYCSASPAIFFNVSFTLYLILLDK